MTLAIRVRRVLPFVLALVLTAVGIRTYLQSIPSGASLSTAVPTVVYIKPKTGVQEIAVILREAGVIRSTWAFLALAYLQGSLKRLQSGEYEFHTGMTLLEILQKLEGGRVVTHQVTIPEGFTAEDIASLLATEHLADPDRFLALVQDAGFAARLNVPAVRLEGYLFPDTYRLTRGMGEEEIIRTMVARFQQSIPSDFQEQASRLHMDPHDIVTLGLSDREGGSLEFGAAVGLGRVPQSAAPADAPAIGSHGGLYDASSRATHHGVRPPAQDPIQHLRRSGASTGSDCQSGSRLAAGGTESGTGQLSVLRGEERRLASVFPNPRTTSERRTALPGWRQGLPG